MLLREIKSYIQEKKAQSFSEIARHFNVATEVLEDMLQLLIRKGQVRLCKKTPVCGTKCQKCSLAETEIYEWVQ